MSIYIDLTHDFEDNMPGFKLKNEDGTFTQYTAHIHPFLTHQQTEPKFKGLCSFEITEISFQTSVGTYIDSPFHRYPGGMDISQIPLNQLIGEGIVIDVRNSTAQQCVDIDIPAGIHLKDKIVLFNFGYDQYWGAEQYYSYPFISKSLIDTLIERGVKLVGVDTVNIDDSANLNRPAHSKLLKANIIICENLKNLDALHNKNFIFYALPIKAKKTAAMPVRAFAEIKTSNI